MIDPIWVRRLNQRLEEIKQREGRTAKSIADSLKVTQGAISMWRNEKRGIRPGVLRRLCEELECSADWLLGFTDDPRPARDTLRVAETGPYYGAAPMAGCKVTSTEVEQEGAGLTVKIHLECAKA